MNHLFFRLVFILSLLVSGLSLTAQERRPIDSKHPLWLIHIDVWNKADPQKIINLIPDDIKPFVCMNLSLSCQYDTEKNVYKMPQNAIRTYKSWGTVCQANGLWFTCQPASGGHTHIQDDDLETFEYFYKRFPNFLGWNYAEQFWGFDEANDRSSSTQTSRIALFANLVNMAHKYGGFLTVSFCGNIWSHPLNPIGMMKRNKDLLAACKNYPEAILWLYKYTTSSCFYNNESVTFSPFVSGLAKSYGVRYDNCGWNGALDAILGENHGKKYPTAAGIGTVMEQMCVNGGTVWDGPELIWTEDFQNLNNSTVDGYTRRNWGTFPSFRGGWMDMFRKIIDGTMYIPTREEVVGKTKVIVINDMTTGSDEQKYAAWGDLYDGIYKQSDPFNRGNGQWMDNFCYFKKTGRYAAIPVAIGLYDDVAKSIPVQVKKSAYNSRWSTQTRKIAEFNAQYPEVSTGDLYVSRFKNQLVTYTPYTYLNKNTTATASIPLHYNTCEEMELTWGKLSSGIIREYADHIDFYLNNYRSDSTTMTIDNIVIKGATTQPSYTMSKRTLATGNATENWNAETGTYTLQVKHNGPIDISIACAGVAEERSTDIADNTSLSLDLPKQPDEYFGEITIEAEDMDFKNIRSCVTDPYGRYPSVRGHAGNGFMDMGTNTAGALRHTINIRHAGAYKIIVRYTSPNRSGNITATVNGTKHTMTCEKTNNNEWRKASINTSLNEGNNTLILTNSNGLNMYIDQVTYAPADTPAEQFLITIRDTEHGKANASVASAEEGENVVLTATPDEGYALAGWEVIHGDIAINDDNTFTMPDDNVTLRPIFADMSSVYTLDYTNVLGGNIPEGWRLTQENNDIHEYPNSYSSGGRTFSGFTGFQGKALYWRVGQAEYGRQNAYPLTLQPGSYKLTFAMAAWKETPRYKVRILDTNNNTIAESPIYSATPNANGNTSANIASAKSYELPFDIAQKGNYIISFTNNGTGFDEFLLLECRINSETSLNIKHETLNINNTSIKIFNSAGVQIPNLQKGMNIIVYPDGTTRKLIKWL
ncbi:MAG: glycosyl hydrolase family 98 [Prevotella sp.]|nr:glycosyl hydrolase family 98 [Prevotella sp.]